MDGLVEGKAGTDIAGEEEGANDEAAETGQPNTPVPLRMIRRT